MRRFIKEDAEMVNKCLKRGSVSLALGMQIKRDTISHYLAKIKNSDNTKCWGGGGETESPKHCWWEWKVIWPLW